jgi:hypothetical protein
MSELLTIEDIAKLWKKEPQWVQRYLVKRPGFPPPVPGSTRKTRRWKPQDVERYLSPAEA